MDSIPSILEYTNINLLTKKKAPLTKGEIIKLLLYSASHRNGFLKLIDSLILVHFIIAVYIYHDISALYQFKRVSLSQYLDFFATILCFDILV